MARRRSRCHRAHAPWVLRCGKCERLLNSISHHLDPFLCTCQSSVFLFWYSRHRSPTVSVNSPTAVPFTTAAAAYAVPRTLASQGPLAITAQENTSFRSHSKLRSVGAPLIVSPVSKKSKLDDDAHLWTCEGASPPLLTRPSPRRARWASARRQAFVFNHMQSGAPEECRSTSLISVK